MGVITLKVTNHKRASASLGFRPQIGGQMAERLENWAINQKVAGYLCCVLGQGTSPYLPRGECPCTYCKSLWIRASAK